MKNLFSTVSANSNNIKWNNIISRETLYIQEITIYALTLKEIIQELYTVMHIED